MNIQAIIASLVLGSSSVAMAAPSVTVSVSAHAGYDTTLVRDHRADDNCDRSTTVMSPPIMRPIGWTLPPVYRPVTLASGLSFANQGRRFITVGSQAGQFEKLEIQAAGGRTFIKQVYVQFDDGQEQVVRNLDRRLTGGESLTLDLDGSRRGIRRIVVYGSDINSGIRRSPGAFTVMAS